MSSDNPMRIKVASEPEEFEQIHALNYQTFVNEIPQHPLNKEKKLVDKYHQENTYVICVVHKEVVGMIALRDTRPLSLDDKLENIESYLPPFKSILEYRLLAVKKEHRNTLTFTGIMKKSFNIAIEGGYDIAVISGTTSQVRLYNHLGFRPFGPLVGKQGALFQPMYIDVVGAKTLKNKLHILKAKKSNEIKQLFYNYMPGPVPFAEGVIEANAAPPISHRSETFIKDFNQLRADLCKLVNAQNVQIMMGSGTLANDVIAGQLSILPGRGIVLINGEFGGRLQDHAIRAGLKFDVVVIQEGTTFSADMLNDKLNSAENITWLWSVHCETSAGVINDIKAVRELCVQHDIKLCVDAISTIGACELDLQGIFLASAVSGKGIGSLPGLAMVFCQNEIVSEQRKLPRFFDLAYYEVKQGIPFTISSNAVYALKAAVNGCVWQKRFSNFKRWSEELRSELEKMGLSILAEPTCRAPHITTIELPNSIISLNLGRKLEEQGLFISYQSEYLIKKNQIQVCFMGGCQKPSPSLILLLTDTLLPMRH